MSPTVLPTRAKAAEGLRGRHVLWRVLGFFGVVFLVNGVMIYSASRPHSGLVAQRALSQGPALQRAHRRGRRRQADLGWTDTLEVGRDGRRALWRSATPTAGRCAACGLTAMLGRPRPIGTTSCSQLAESQRPDATRRASPPLAEGNWLVSLEPRARGRGPDLPHAEAHMAEALSTQRGQTSTRCASAGDRQLSDRHAGRRRRRWPSRTCIAAAACAKSRPALTPFPASSRRARQPVGRGVSPRCTGRPASTAPTWSRRSAGAGFKAAELAEDSEATARARRPGFPQARRRRRLCRRQHHAAVGLGVVGRRRRHEPVVQALFHWLSALIALPAVAYAGQPFFRFGRAGACVRAASTWTCRSRSASRWPRP